MANKVLLVLNQVTAASTFPTGDAGEDLIGLRHSVTKEIPEFATLALRATRSGGACTFQVRVWFRFPVVTWCPLGLGALGAKGVINDGSDLDEEPTLQEVRHAQLIRLPEHADRVFYQVLTPTNLGAVDGVLVATAQFPDA